MTEKERAVREKERAVWEKERVIREKEVAIQRLQVCYSHTGTHYTMYRGILHKRPWAFIREHLVMLGLYMYMFCPCAGNCD